MNTASQQAFPDPGWATSMAFQPMAKHYVTKRGDGNVMGLDKSLTQNSIIWLLMASAVTVDQEKYFQDKFPALTAELQAFAIQKNGYTQWQYYNYVSPTQNPLVTYGRENVNLMKQVASKYDPKGFFQTRVSGGFKISKVA